MTKPIYNAEKMFTFVRGYALGANMPETVKALNYAREKHKDQKRKSGEPYIVHPLTMACHAISLGVTDDTIIATILLHDVCEDCGVSLAELPVGDAVKEAVDYITFVVNSGETKTEAKNRYYNAMLRNRAATIAKLFDRCHNVSSMAGTFSEEKLVAYIEETRQYVLPLLQQAKYTYPEYSDPIFALKYHITSIVDSIEAAMDAFSS